MSDGTTESSQGHCWDKRGVEIGTGIIGGAVISVVSEMAYGSVVVRLVTEMAPHSALDVMSLRVLKSTLMACWNHPRLRQWNQVDQ